jgi:hypothetical protein
MKPKFKGEITMKTYDFKAIKKFIENDKGNIAVASLGIREDWFWTSETVFENGEFTKNLDDITTIAGIEGSSWATPVLHIEDKDGNETFKEAYVGENSNERPLFNLTSGCLSGPCQNKMEEVKIDGKI